MDTAAETLAETVAASGNVGLEDGAVRTLPQQTEQPPESPPACLPLPSGSSASVGRPIALSMRPKRSNSSAVSQVSQVSKSVDALQEFQRLTWLYISVAPCACACVHQAQQEFQQLTWLYIVVDPCACACIRNPTAHPWRCEVTACACA